MDRQRLRQRIAQRPNAVRFQEIKQLLEAYGWEHRHGKGSHEVFTRAGERFVVPFRRRHVSAVYVRQALQRCKE